MRYIAILGGGFGGLHAARVLSKKLRSLGLLSRYEIVIVDKNKSHTYTPLLYEAATTPESIADKTKLHSVTAYDFRFLLESLPVRFVNKEIDALDPINGFVAFTDKETLQADYLVIALGSEPHFFGLRGAKEHALTFKTFEDAIRIRNRISMCSSTGKEFSLVIGGAGPTGVELAGEVIAWRSQRDSPVKECGLSVTIIDSSPTVLPGMDGRVIKAAEARLRKLGVRVLNGLKMKEVTREAVILENGLRVPFTTFIWSGGVKAPSILGKMPFKTEARGRIEVLDGLECLPQTRDLALRSRVYALGDNICFYDPVTREPIAGVARAAISQADVVAHNIAQDIAHKEGLTQKLSHRAYKPMHYPYIVPVGGKYAIAKIGPVVINGFFGWVLKGLVELNYLLSIMNPLRAIHIWIKGLFIFIQNDRLG